jgi:hypothetical protein
MKIKHWLHFLWLQLMWRMFTHILLQKIAPKKVTKCILFQPFINTCTPPPPSKIALQFCLQLLHSTFTFCSLPPPWPLQNFPSSFKLFQASIFALSTLSMKPYINKCVPSILPHVKQIILHFCQLFGAMKIAKNN